MILIVATADDIHALSVMKAIYELRPNAKIAIFDASEFPLKASLNFTPDGWRLRHCGGAEICSNDVTSLWWRRWRPHNLSDDLIDPAARRFANNECAHAFSSIGLWPGYKVINPIEKEWIANRKITQLQAALKAGLTIPRTLVSNDPVDARQFSTGRNTVFKVLTASLSSLAETRRLTHEHHEKLGSVIHSPVIFQEELDKAEDIRVTVVDNEIFSAIVATNNPAAKKYPDWRLDASSECRPCELPANVLRGVRALMTDLGLKYSAMDFIRTKDGEYYFLEINPSGQFLFVEADTGQQISKAMAVLLLGDEP